MIQLLSERKRKKLKKKHPQAWSAVSFVPNYFENPLETPAFGDGPFASLGGQPANEQDQESTKILFEADYTINEDTADIHSMYVEVNLAQTMKNFMSENKSVKRVIFNPGKSHTKMFNEYKKYYGNYIILAEK